jgi:hypothetical protein
MAGVKLRKGDKIRAKVHHNGVKSGTEGKVTGVYSGTYYAVNYPGVSGVCYTPDPLADMADSSAPTRTEPGISSPALNAADEHVQRVSTWERLMSMVGVS